MIITNSEIVLEFFLFTSRKHYLVMLRMRNSFTFTSFFSTSKMLEMPNTNTNQQGKNSVHSVEESYQVILIFKNFFHSKSDSSSIEIFLEHYRKLLSL